MKPNREYVIYVMEPTGGLVGHPLECHLLKVLHEDSDNSEPMVTLFIQLAIETEGETRMWWNSLKLPSSSCQLRKSKESPIGTLMKRQYQS